MKVLVAIVLCIWGVSAELRQPPLETPMEMYENMHERIINGKPAVLGQLPHQASIYWEDAQGGGHMCGGTLIHKNWVVTAAHCAVGVKFVLNFGTINFAQGGQSRVAERVIVHEKYNPSNLNFDIALLYFSQPITETNNIKIAKLPLVGQTIGANVKLVTSGWGKTGDNNGTSKTLNVIDVISISNVDCQAIFGGSIISSTLCCKGDGGKSTCSGDSGGPLVIAGNPPTLVGIVSFVHKNGCEWNLPFGFVRVEVLLPWILTYVKF